MADEQKHYPGGHYSGTNKIPTVDRFLAGLDKDKKARDAKIDAELAEQKKSAKAKGSGEVKEHKATPAAKGEKEVTDPVGGQTVVIADANKEFVRNARDPQLSVPKYVRVLHSEALYLTTS